MKLLKSILYEASAVIVAVLVVFYAFCFLKVSFAHATEPALIAVDGDTVKDSRTVFRLQHYDTPEIGHAKCDKEHALGLKAKLRMQQIIIEGDYRLVSSGKKEKYGRTLATLYSHNVPTDKIFISEGLASPYEGRGPKKDWCN